MAKVKEELPGYFEFFCPGCKERHVICTNPKFGPVWQFNKDLDRPTASPSLLVRWNDPDGNHVCHSFIRDGKIQFLNDCTHELKGQTIDIPEWV